MRQGRKASTLVTGFEAFLLTPEFLSEELKRICATSSSGNWYFTLSPNMMLSCDYYSISCPRKGKCNGSTRTRETNQARHGSFDVSRSTKTVDRDLWYLRQKEMMGWPSQPNQHGIWIYGKEFNMLLNPLYTSFLVNNMTDWVLKWKPQYAYYFGMKITQT